MLLPYPSLMPLKGSPALQGFTSKPVRLNLEELKADRVARLDTPPRQTATNSGKHSTMPGPSAYHLPIIKAHSFSTNS